MTQVGALVGIDVSKGKLEWRIRGSARGTAANTPCGGAALAEELLRQGVSVAVMEASGGYERASAAARRNLGHRGSDRRSQTGAGFRQGGGRRAKTDPIDADTIASGQHFGSSPHWAVEGPASCTYGIIPIVAFNATTPPYTVTLAAPTPTLCNTGDLVGLGLQTHSDFYFNFLPQNNEVVAYNNCTSNCRGEGSVRTNPLVFRPGVRRQHRYGLHRQRVEGAADGPYSDQRDKSPLSRQHLQQRPQQRRRSVYNDVYFINDQCIGLAAGAATRNMVPLGGVAVSGGSC